MRIPALNLPANLTPHCTFVILFFFFVGTEVNSPVNSGRSNFTTHFGNKRERRFDGGGRGERIRIVSSHTMLPTPPCSTLSPSLTSPYASSFAFTTHISTRLACPSLSTYTLAVCVCVISPAFQCLNVIAGFYGALHCTERRRFLMAEVRLFV